MLKASKTAFKVAPDLIPVYTQEWISRLRLKIAMVGQSKRCGELAPTIFFLMKAKNGEPIEGCLAESVERSITHFDETPGVHYVTVRFNDLDMQASSISEPSLFIGMFQESTTTEVQLALTHIDENDNKRYWTPASASRTFGPGTDFVERVWYNYFRQPYAFDYTINLNGDII